MLIGRRGDVGALKILRDLTDRKKRMLSKNVKELEDLNAHKENVLAISGEVHCLG
jgi:two-component system CheB/CheR fusion protein